MIRLSSDNEQVAEQSSEAQLPAPVSVQREIHRDPYASCLVTSAGSKRPRREYASPRGHAVWGASDLGRIPTSQHPMLLHHLNATQGDGV